MHLPLAILDQLLPGEREQLAFIKQSALLSRIAALMQKHTIQQFAQIDPSDPICLQRRYYELQATLQAWQDVQSIFQQTE